MTQYVCIKILALIYFCGSGKRLQQTGCHITSGTLESVTSQDNFRKYRVQFKSIILDKYQLPFDCDVAIWRFTAESPNAAATSHERRHFDYDHLGNRSMFNTSK